MARSKTDICNRALARISSSRISSIDDAVDPNAALCRDAFDGALDYAISRVSPQCAQAEATLARLAGDSGAGADGCYRYALPKAPRCLRVLALNGGRATWTVIGPVLKTTADRAQALYLYRPDDMDSLPEHVVAVIVLKLACELARVKQGTDSTHQRLLEELETVTLADAHLQERLLTANDGNDTVNPKGTWHRG